MIENRTALIQCERSEYRIFQNSRFCGGTGRKRTIRNITWIELGLNRFFRIGTKEFPTFTGKQQCNTFICNLNIATGTVLTFILNNQFYLCRNKV